MKISKMKYLITCLVAVFTVAIFITSCQQEESNVAPEQPNEHIEPVFATSGKFSKQLILKDESGMSSVTLSISSDDESLLSDYTDEVFYLEVYFEKPDIEEPKKTEFEQQQTPINFDREVVFIKVIEEELENGVIGFGIGNNPTANSRIEGVNWYFTNKNNLKVRSIYGCVGTQFYAKFNGYDWAHVVDTTLCYGAYNTVHNYWNFDWLGVWVFGHSKHIVSYYN